MVYNDRMLNATQLPQMSHTELQVLAASLMAQLTQKDQELLWRKTRIEQLTHEIATLRRIRFSATRERLHRDGDPEQAELWGSDLSADLAAMQAELEALSDAPSATESATPAPARRIPKRKPLPEDLPRTVIAHEPDSTVCGCGSQMQRIGEDVAEKLDFIPGVFHVERHVRGKWVCRCCETLVQAPVPAHVIDKGMPTAGLLADVVVGKYVDHLPLYRKEHIYGRAGLAIPRSTLAAWAGQVGVALQPLADAMVTLIKSCAVVHADETPVQMLQPGAGKTHRAYLWAYAPATSQGFKAVVYDFCTSRGGQHVRDFLGQWRGTLVCDDYAAYKALFAQGVTEAGCMAHARRKFYELHAANNSPLAAVALEYIGKLYEIERLTHDVTPQERLRVRQTKSQPIMNAWHEWLITQRDQLTANSPTAKAIDYSLKRWRGLSQFLHDGAVPIDNNPIENLIRPITLGRNNWLFAGSERAGKRAAAIQSLLQSAKLNGLDPHAWLKDVLQRLPTHRASAIEELLPHRWQPLTG